LNTIMDMYNNPNTDVMLELYNRELKKLSNRVTTLYKCNKCGLCCKRGVIELMDNEISRIKQLKQLKKLY
jgi:hypothetical protein